jgi:hypothetical protein
MPKLTGGGANSRQVVRTSNPKREPINNAVSMNRPSMIGLQHWVNQDKGPLYQHGGVDSTPKGPTPMTPDQCRPGGGRQILACGTQSSNRPAPSKIASGRSLFK